MTKKPDMPISPGVKPSDLQERAVADYPDLAKALQECTWKGAKRRNPIPSQDRSVVHQAGAEHALREGISGNEGVTLACWVYWKLLDERS